MNHSCLSVPTTYDNSNDKGRKKSRIVHQIYQLFLKINTLVDYQVTIMDKRAKQTEIE